MYKILFLFLALFALAAAGVPPALAAGLTCDDVSGASIFGYDGDEYVYIGSISNEYGSDSIANEFGSYGSEFSSKSVFNEFAKWGNEFGSYSATNEFSSKPPLLVGKDFKKIGYLTANDVKYPSMNIYVAKICAKRTITSAADHEGIKFENESDLVSLRQTGSSSASINPDLYCKVMYGAGAIAIGTSCFCGDGYTLNAQKNGCTQNTVTCPANSSPKGNACECNTGFLYNQTLNACIDYTSSCRFRFGTNSYGDSQYCYCTEGYEFSKDGGSCVQKTPQPITPPSAQSSAAETPTRSSECSGLLKINGQCIAPSQYCEASGVSLEWSDALGRCICKAGHTTNQEGVCVDRDLECRNSKGNTSYFNPSTNTCATCPTGTAFDSKDRQCKPLPFQGIPKTKAQLLSCNVVAVKSTKLYYLKSNTRIKNFSVSGKTCFVTEAEAIKAKYKKGK